MAKQRIELEALGSAVAQVLGQAGPRRSHAIEQARAMYLANFERERSQASRSRGGAARRWLLGLVPAVAAAAAVALFIWARSVTPLSFRVDGKRGELDAWLAPPVNQSLFVDFSDGTGLRIEEQSRARVMGVATHGAKVSLESGSIHAEVAHTRQSAWSFIAGPLNVRVIGTKFDLKWDPSAEHFSVAVTEGSVGVSGSLAGAERPVRAGETLSISLRDQRLELINTSHDAVGQTPVEPVLPAADTTAAPAPSATAQQENAATHRAPQWRELAQRGQLREAYAAAESFGFSEACQAASPSELLLLGDAARLAGRADRANTALLALRQRYPNDSRRAAAAFVLGKIAFDQRHAYDLAASWFSTCLREQPTGGFAREAAGRLVEAHRSAGNASAAQTAARSYLARYPNGPHADLARSLLP